MNGGLIWPFFGDVPFTGASNAFCGVFKSNLKVTILIIKNYQTIWNYPLDVNAKTMIILPTQQTMMSTIKYLYIYIVHKYLLEIQIKLVMLCNGLVIIVHFHLQWTIMIHPYRWLNCKNSQIQNKDMLLSFPVWILFYDAVVAMWL